MILQTLKNSEDELNARLLILKNDLRIHQGFIADIELTIASGSAISSQSYREIVSGLKAELIKLHEQIKVREDQLTEVREQIAGLESTS